MVEKKFYVYQLRIEGNDLPFYVGKGSGKRVHHHNRTCNLKKPTHKNNIINKARRENKKILVEFLETEQYEKDAFLFEQYYISAYGRYDLGMGQLTNKTDGGEGVSGRISSEETRKKMSDSHKGKKTGTDNHNFGVSFGLPFIEKIREKAIGRTHTQETKDKISASSEHRPPISEDTRAKMRKPKSASHIEKLKGRKHTKETKEKILLSSKRKSYRVVSPDGTVYEGMGIKSFCKENKLDTQLMYEVCNGKRKQYKGWTGEYT